MKLLQTKVTVALIGMFSAIIVAAFSAVSSHKNRKNAIDGEFKSGVTGMLDEIRQQHPVILHRIDALEKKQDASNEVKERLARVEESAKAAHKRLDRTGAGE